VATGGGVISRPQNWGVLHQGIVIWIDPGRDRLLDRLQKDPCKRPLLQGDDPVATFDELLTKRDPLYREADLHVIIGEESHEEVAKKILEELLSILISQEGKGAPRTTAG